MLLSVVIKLSIRYFINFFFVFIYNSTTLLLFNTQEGHFVY